MAQATIKYGSVQWSVSGGEAFVRQEYQGFIERMGGIKAAKIAVGAAEAAFVSKEHAGRFAAEAKKSAEAAAHAAHAVNGAADKARRSADQAGAAAVLAATAAKVAFDGESIKRRTVASGAAARKPGTVILHNVAVNDGAADTEIDLATLKAIINSGRAGEIIQPFDLMDIQMADGDTVSAMCGYVGSTFARFVLIKNWGDHLLDKNPERAKCYYGSMGRKYILREIYRKLPEALLKVIRPRSIRAVVGRETFAHEDSLWLLSVGDVFPPEALTGRWPVEEDSFQLPIYRQTMSRKKQFPQLWSERILRTVSTDVEKIQYGLLQEGGSLVAVPASKPCPFIVGFDL